MQSIADIGPDLEATFVPGDPARAGWFALWSPASPGGLFADHSSNRRRLDLELIVPADRGTRCVVVSCERLSVAAAIEAFARMPIAAPVTASVQAWARVVTAALELVARGRVLPWVSPTGWDSWRLDPLDPDDHRRVDELVAALPAVAHAVRSPAGRGRITDPEFAVRSCYDAVADRILRPAAASALSSSPVFAQVQPTRVPHLRAWVDDIATTACADTTLVLSVERPERPGAPWPVVLRSASRRDPEIVVDAADLAQAPAAIRRRLGPRAELELYVAARRAAQAVPALGRALHDAVPSSVFLDDTEIDQVLAALPSLRRNGIEVRWPTELAAAIGLGVRARPATRTGAPPGGQPGGASGQGGVARLAAQLAELGGGREQVEPAGLAAVLRPYQRRGLAWMDDLCSIGLGGCLADDMGLGKTVQVLALHALRGGPTLVVCPTGLVANWAREASRFVADARVQIYHGAGRRLDPVGPGDLVLTTYGVVRSDAAQLASVPWDVVVADEAQQLKNPRSRATRSMRTIPARSRLALTGTPIENRLADLWSILEWAVPGLLGPYEAFRRDVAVPIERDGDVGATQQLQAIVRPFLLRRRKTDPGIAPDLPPKVEHDLVVELTAEQEALYRAAVADSLHRLTDTRGIERRGLVLQLLTALKQITNHPAHHLGQTGPLAGRSGKLEALEDLLDAAIDGGESTLVFTQYVAMGHLLVDHLRTRGTDVAMLHGSLSRAARSDLVDRFQAGVAPVLVLSLKAAGTGLNLTRASQVVHYDRWWNPAVEDQATDRAHRIGQRRTVTVHRLITQGTVEDRVGELLAQKRRLAERIVGSGESWIGDLDDEALARLVSLDDRPRTAGGLRSARPDPTPTLLAAGAGR